MQAEEAKCRPTEPGERTCGKWEDDCWNHLKKLLLL